MFATVRGTAEGWSEGPWHVLLLSTTGVVTALPLILFAGAANKVPLATVGLLQYIAPTLQFILGVAVFGEDMPLARWLGFLLVWLALAILTVDSLAAVRRSHLDHPRPSPVPSRLSPDDPRVQTGA